MTSKDDRAGDFVAGLNFSSMQVFFLVQFFLTGQSECVTAPFDWPIQENLHEKLSPEDAREVLEIAAKPLLPFLRLCLKHGVYTGLPDVLTIKVERK